MEKIFSATKPITEKGKMYHVRVAPDEVGRYVLLPGDPDRVKVIAQLLKEHRPIVEHREFTVYNGYVEGELVTVCSTGIGCPATAIAIEELLSCGARTFIRVGSCGAIQAHLKIGDLVIATGAVRLDGTSKAYIFSEYPAVASLPVLIELKNAAERLNFKHHVGIIASTDSFYVGQSRPGFNEYMLPEHKDLINILGKVNVLCFEMETSTLFTLANIYNFNAGSVLAVFANRVTGEFQVKGEEEAAKTAVECIRNLIQKKYP
ncbi:MAG: nucleoside phosphorylase [Nitrososphaeria archaeon]